MPSDIAKCPSRKGRSTIGPNWELLYGTECVFGEPHMLDVGLDIWDQDKYGKGSWGVWEKKKQLQ